MGFRIECWKALMLAWVSAYLIRDATAYTGIHPLKLNVRKAFSGHNLKMLVDEDMKSYVPYPKCLEIEDPDCRVMLGKIERVSLELPSEVADNPVTCTYNVVNAPGNKKTDVPPVVLLHGFDSSQLEFRRLMPQLEEMGVEAYALDILGCGFGQYLDIKEFSARAKRSALKAFCDTVLGGRPICVVGASLGGAAAIDFAFHHPDSVSSMVLIDGQGFIDGTGPGAVLPGPLARLGIKVLQSNPLRSMANQMSYYNTDVFATDDAVRIGRLHTFRDGWEDANVKYMASGGYTVSPKVPEVATKTLVLWGEQDKILEPQLYAERFLQEMKDVRLEYIPECGHVPHLEQAFLTAQKISLFLEENSIVANSQEVLASQNRQ
eukprot:CAMPEP_0113943638 /NCGR_PEP_ID=MMETSP1339-20121228/26945_1 /TAXON_ID=94617 /ORGANISM="Fibrocapsa japonica" /LENGTH=376 /DNA_ID=CAMNT_0000948575 /DNA_START=45 /DNA_END=1175 /DNA_ORIENTATION=- /assembly_acc=CAM_ASM_000762